MKTAMQELINSIQGSIDHPQTIDKQKYVLISIKLFAQALLEREKEQILNDYMEGVDAGVLYSNGKVFISKEEYYNRTYSQDRELGKEVTDLLENYKKDKTFKQKSKWTKL